MQTPLSDHWDAGDADPVDLGLLSGDVPKAFNGLIRAAAAVCSAPVGLISIIDETMDRQVFAGQIGLPSPWRDLGETPLSHSFCQHVKANGTLLIVEDARNHPLVGKNKAIEALGVIAYLGAPVRGANGDVLGALCVIDHKPRHWAPRDIALMEDLAQCVSDEIALRAHSLRQEKLLTKLQVAHARLKRYTVLQEQIARPVLAPGLDLQTRLCSLLNSTMRAFGYTTAQLAVVDPQQADRLRIVARVGPSGRMPNGASVLRAGTLAEHVLQTCRILSRDVTMPSEWRHDLTGVRMGDYAAAPLLVDNTAMGVIEVTGNSLRPTSLNYADEAVLGLAAMFASAVIELSQEPCILAAPMAAPMVLA